MSISSDEQFCIAVKEYISTATLPKNYKPCLGNDYKPFPDPKFGIKEISDYFELGQFPKTYKPCLSNYTPFNIYVPGKPHAFVPPPPPPPPPPKVHAPPPPPPPPIVEPDVKIIEFVEEEQAKLPEEEIEEFVVPVEYRKLKSMVFAQNYILNKILLICLFNAAEQYGDLSLRDKLISILKKYNIKSYDKFTDAANTSQLYQSLNAQMNELLNEYNARYVGTGEQSSLLRYVKYLTYKSNLHVISNYELSNLDKFAETVALKLNKISSA